MSAEMDFDKYYDFVPFSHHGANLKLQKKFLPAVGKFDCGRIICPASK